MKICQGFRCLSMLFVWYLISVHEAFASFSSNITVCCSRRRCDVAASAGRRDPSRIHCWTFADAAAIGQDDHWTAGSHPHWTLNYRVHAWDEHWVQHRDVPSAVIRARRVHQPWAYPPIGSRWSGRELNLLKILCKCLITY